MHAIEEAKGCMQKGKDFNRLQAKFFWRKPFSGETPSLGEKSFLGRSHFWGEALFGEKPFSGRSHFLGRSHFRGEAIFQTTLLPLVKNVSSHFRNQEVSKPT